MTENIKTELRLKLAHILLENRGDKTLEQCAKIVDDNLQEIVKLFDIHIVSNSLDKMIETVEKKKGHQWRSKVNAIGYVKHILANDC